MNDPRFPEVRLNVVEQEGWKPFDSAENDLMDRANDAAYEDFDSMSAEDLESYVDDLLEAKSEKGRKPRRKFTSDEIEWLAEQVKDGHGTLEETRRAIIDAMIWMYEAAAMPNKSDMIDAFEDAKRMIVDDYPIESSNEGEEYLWESVLLLKSRRRGPKEWSPRKRVEREELLRDLMDHVDFEWDEDQYDRYIIFDFRNAQVVHDLLSRSHWTEAQLIGMLQAEFTNLRVDFMSDFFSALKKAMKDIDISNRTDWRSAWRSMLNSGIAPEVQREMTEALKKMEIEKERELDADA